VLLDVDGLVLGLVSILEQGHRRMSNNTGRTALCILAASNMLVNIVLSNAFKGNNIQSVLAELNYIPYTHFDQIINSSFDIFTQSDSGNYERLFMNSDFITEFEKNAKRYGYQYNETKLARIFESLRKHPIDEGWYVNDTNITYISVLSECNKTALVGWTSQLRSMQKELSRVNNVFLGKEVIFTREFGSKIQHWFDPRVLDRMRRVRDSGIQHEWMTVFKKTIPPLTVEPQKASLQGNIVVEFSILGIGLGCATIPFIAEMRKPILKVIDRLHRTRNKLLRRIWDFLLRLLFAVFCPYSFFKRFV